MSPRTKAYLGLVNPTNAVQMVTVELFPEGTAPMTFDLALNPKSRRGVELNPWLPPNSAFGTLVHFGTQGIASLVLRDIQDFFGAPTQMIPGQLFCREAQP